MKKRFFQLYFLMTAIVISSFASVSYASSDSDILFSRVSVLLSSGAIDEAVNVLNNRLIEQPLDLKARLVRSKILVELGRGGEVKEDLQTLLKLNLPESDKQEIVTLLDRIDGKIVVKDPFHGSFKVLVGGSFSDNVNGWSKTGEGIVSGQSVSLPTTLYGDRKKHTDFIASLNLSSDGQYQFNHQLLPVFFYQFSGKFDEGNDTVEKDLTQFDGTLGLLLTLSDQFSFIVSYNQLKMDRVNEQTVEQIVGNANTSTTHSLNIDLDASTYSATLGYQINRAHFIRYAVALSENDFSKLSSADNFDSESISHGISYYYQHSSRTRSYTGLTFSENEADLDLESARSSSNKDTNIYYVGVDQVLNSGHVVNVKFSRYEIDYKNQIVGRDLREDRYHILDVNYRLPARSFHIDTPVLSSLNTWDFDINYSLFDSSSNQIAASIRSNTIGLTMSRNWNY